MSELHDLAVAARGAIEQFRPLIALSEKLAALDSLAQGLEEVVAAKMQYEQQMETSKKAAVDARSDMSKAIAERDARSKELEGELQIRRDALEVQISGLEDSLRNLKATYQEEYRGNKEKFALFLSSKQSELDTLNSRVTSAQATLAATLEKLRGLKEGILA